MSVDDGDDVAGGGEEQAGEGEQVGHGNPLQNGMGSVYQPLYVYT